jgi:hypothetical protein
MGVPHRGSELATWGTKIFSYFDVIKRSNFGVVADLNPTSKALQAVEYDFQRMLRHDDVQIRLFSFYEIVPMRLVGYIVPRESAVLNGEPYNGINQDDEDMTKFSSDRDEGFGLVVAVLREWNEIVQGIAT